MPVLIKVKKAERSMGLKDGADQTDRGRIGSVANLASHSRKRVMCRTDKMRMVYT
jgi:hypothetical protein